MTHHDLARLVSKLLGLFIIASTVIGMIFIFPTWQFQESRLSWQWMVGFYVIPELIGLTIGVIFLRADKRIADALVIKYDATDLNSAIDYKEVESILIALLGLYLTADGIPPMIYALSNFVIVSFEIGFLALPNLEFVAKQSVQIFIGIGLFLGSGGLMLWRRRFLNIRYKVQTWDADK